MTSPESNGFSITATIMAKGNNLVKPPSHRQCSKGIQWSVNVGCFKKAVFDELNKGIQNRSKAQDGYVQMKRRLEFRHTLNATLFQSQRL
jgi:outer membrane cobalamin receptor